MISRLTDAFPLWVAVAAAIGWFHPAIAAPFGDPPTVRVMLAIVMLGMGLTLSVEDFRRVLARPKDVGVAAAAQYTIMPLLAWGLAELLSLPPGLAVGLILVGCAPGGTASNLITYLARGDTPLSVLMTAVSTALAVVMTPFLTQLLAGKHMPVDGWALLRDTATVVLLPVAVGVLLNRYAENLTKSVMPAAPLVSVLAIALIVGGIVARSGEVIATAVLPMMTAVLLLHAGGYGLGWVVGRLFRWDVPSTRTLSIEVGMQNSGLAASLAQRHFPTEPTAAALGAVSAVLQSLLGSAVASWWRRRAG